MTANTKLKNQKQKIGDEFPTDWNIDAYRNEHESTDHWELRRSFMGANKSKFPEDELVCLARVFTNMEFLGCRYPSETMHLVAEMSQDIAKEFRAKRAHKLKRTFVSASDAAEARAKDSVNRFKTIDSRPHFGNGKISHVKKLFDNLLFGEFVLFLTNDRNCIKNSAQRANLQYNEKEASAENQLKVFEIFVNDKLLACKTSTHLKTAKTEAFYMAIEFLQRNCYTILLNPSRDFIVIEKSNNKVVCDIKQNESEDMKLDMNNKGYKIMKLMGWRGGGLGLNQQGRKNPVDYLFRNNRAGFGNEANTFDRKYFKNLLQNYVQSQDIRELRFEATFSKEDRIIIHEIASTMHLKSHSHGKGELRSLIVSKKNLTAEHILTEILFNKNPTYCYQYKVKVPECKEEEFPDHAANLNFARPNNDSNESSLRC